MAEERKEAEFNAFTEKFCEAFGEDLTGLIGSDIQIVEPVVTASHRNNLFDDEVPLAFTKCVSKDGSGTHLIVILPVTDAVVLGALLMVIGSAHIEERKTIGLDAEMLDAYGEIMNVANGILSRALEAIGAGGLQAGTTTEISIDDTENLPEGVYRLLRHHIAFPDGFGSGRVDIVIPAASDEAWFGGETADDIPDDETRDEERAQREIAREERGEIAEELEIGPIAVVDSNDDDRSDAEGMEDALGVSVWTFEPKEFGLELLEEIAEACAVIVEWDLSGQSGLDVLETLLIDERTRNIPVFLSSSAPTERIVVTALRAGARSFLMKPFDPDEVKRRLSPWVPFEASE